MGGRREDMGGRGEQHVNGLWLCNHAFPHHIKSCGCTINKQPSHVRDPRGVKFGATTQTQRVTKARAKARMQAIRTISIE